MQITTPTVDSYDQIYHVFIMLATEQKHFVASTGN